MWGRILSLWLFLVLVGCSLASEECIVGKDGECRDGNNDCVNKNQNEGECDSWARQNECDNNPEYMYTNCQKSCGLCGLPEEELQAATFRMVGGGDFEKYDETGEDAAIDETPYGVEQAAVRGFHRVKVERNILEMEDYMEMEVFVDPKYDKVRDICRNRHKQCAYWKTTGLCEKGRAFMQTHCAPMCQTCMDMDMSYRCAVPENATNVLEKGDLNRMFERIVNEEQYKEYKPRILSMPPLTISTAPWVDSLEPKTGAWVVVLDEFLTDEECDRLVELGEELGYKRSLSISNRKTFDGTTQSRENTKRTSENAWCNSGKCSDDPLTQSVVAKIENLTGVPKENYENLQLLRYSVGQFYGVHHDYLSRQRDISPGARVLTVFLYLNDVEAGGETDFPLLSLKVSPKKGRALIWPSVKDEEPHDQDASTAHQALAVEEGIKYAANAWIHQRNFQEGFIKNCQ